MRPQTVCLALFVVCVPLAAQSLQSTVVDAVTRVGSAVFDQTRQRPMSF